MKKKATLFFIYIFIAIIFTPLTLVALRVKIDTINKNEKKIGLNFKRNFPLRGDLFKLFAYLKSDVLTANPIPKKVIDTHNGWKFLGNSYSNALSESKGLIVFSKAELNQLKTNLLEKQKWLNQRGIKLYISIAPNKHSVYGDMIPIKKVNRNTKLEQLDSLCQKNNISFINLGSNFPKKNNSNLYLKNDSHWSNIGGYYAYKSTIDKIASDFPKSKFNLLKLEDLDIKKFFYPMADLNRTLFLEQNEELIDVKLKTPITRVLQEKKLTAPKNYKFSDHFYEERYKTNLNDLKIMYLRDSFFGAYYHLIAENFGESLFIWRHLFDQKLITSEKPDILCYEIVERNIDLLLVKEYTEYGF